MSDDLSKAIQEAYASAVSSDIIYHTLEINSKSMATPLYFTQSNETITARIEAGAEYNSQALVSFLNYPFEFRLPKRAGNYTPELQITLDNIDFSFVNIIEKTAQEDDKINIIYRTYTHSRLENAPEIPLELQVSAISFNTRTITITAKFDDLANKTFPSKTYKPLNFPGLSR